MLYAERYPPAQLARMREHDLVGLAQNGNRAAFQELIARSRDGCIRMATVILRNAADAEDEVQNAFCKAYTHLSLFGRQSTFSTWVTRIVINHCLMRHRRSQRLRFVSFENSGYGGGWHVVHEPVGVETPEHGVGRDELNNILRSELRRIPPLLRVPLEMRFFQERSVEDVADTLGISIAAAKSRLHRAQVYLKDRMLRHCGRRGAATLTRVA